MPMNRIRIHRREQGLCAVCGDPSETYHCQDCRDYRNAREKALYARKLGRPVREYHCSVCGDAEHTKRRCPNRAYIKALLERATQ